MPLRTIRNRDLATEIHHTKNTYCQYQSKAHEDYDIILLSPGNNGSRLPKDPPPREEGYLQICEELKTRLKQNGVQCRRNRLAFNIKTARSQLQEIEEWLEKGESMYGDILPMYEMQRRRTELQQRITWWQNQECNEHDVVFRLMTYEHIPRTEPKVKPQWESDNYEFVNFPPFKHLVCKDGIIELVGASHRLNGEFSLERGRISPWLYGMWQTMVDRIALKNNWQGYADLQDMKHEALMRLMTHGLKFNEADFRKTACNGIKQYLNPFSYLTSLIENNFKQFRNKFNYNATFLSDNWQEINLELHGEEVLYAQ